MKLTEEIRRFNNYLGDMDLFLMDQVLKGLLIDKKKILDIGCGEGRNLIFFLQSDFEVYAIDREKGCVDLCRYIAKELNYKETDHIREADLEELPYEDASMDVIICSRVLHFSENEDHFLKMWKELKRVVAVGGFLYLTMDSMIGMENQLKKVDHYKWQFPDGTIRFLLNEQLIGEMAITESFRWVEPIKTVIYGSRHAESVLILEKIEPRKI